MDEHGISPPPRESIYDALSVALGDVVDEANASPIWAAWSRWFALVTFAMPKMQVFTVTFNPASVNANTTSEQTITVTGVKLARDVVLSVTKPSHTAGIGIVNARVSADDTVAITFSNSTGLAVDAGSESYVIVTLRK